MDYLFYVKCPGNDSGCFDEPEKELRPLFWHPSFKSSLPPYLKSPVFAVWTFMHFCHLFSNQDYGVFLIFRGMDLVHRSCVFPKYFRFPFMIKKDLQIGDTWTDPKYRGRGLAAYAMKKITHLQKAPGRRFWYVTERENIASIRAAEKAGFVKFGEGVRTKRFGHNLFGTFEMMTRFDDSGSAKGK
jgi:RimJ/RimL family protein N-acetyltransferase